MIGFMGGEVLCHPQFPEFCEYALTKFPPEQLGLWSSFPKGYDSYRELICKTFKQVFLNDHSRNDIYHAPILVAAEEVVPHRGRMFLMANVCWLHEAWSASINPNGAFFCEVAASMSLLFGTGKGWPVEKEWWMRSPKDYTEQIEEYCPKCGCALPLKRRPSIDGRDDISPGNLKRLEGRSLKIAKGKYIVHDLTVVNEPEQMAAYKDQRYRDQIAARYGMFLVLNDKGFLTPYLTKNFDPMVKKKSLFETYREESLTQGVGIDG